MGQNGRTKQETLQRWWRRSAKEREGSKRTREDTPEGATLHFSFQDVPFRFHNGKVRSIRALLAPWTKCFYSSNSEHEQQQQESLE
jgi:hypothetical protein